jgi:hypothetical protein
MYSGLAAGLVAGALAAGYHFGWRRWLATWGATADEVDRPLPGDEVRSDADLVTTRAIAISAPPSSIWPWLVQMGSGRAGTYSYDWVENLLGLDMHSADVILPQFQNIALGDEFPLRGRNGVMRITTLEPERSVAFCCMEGKWVSSYSLFPSEKATRLVSRNRIALGQDCAASRMFSAMLLEPSWMLFERKMLIGIKDRAERHARESRYACQEAGTLDDLVWAGEHL